jgi:uncharacterized phage protein (TIGR02218 family)
MKTPTWESSPGAGAAFLLSVTGRGSASKGAIRDLYTLTLRDGTTVRRWTPHTASLTIGARTFVSRTDDASVPLITRSGSRCVAGLSEVGALQVTLRCDAATLWGGVPLPMAVIDGLFYGATLAVERLVCSVSAGALTPVAAYSVFFGKVEAQPTSTSVTLSVESLAAQLARISFPRGVVQERCQNQLGDWVCQVLMSGFTFTSVVYSGPTEVSIPTGLGQAPGYFDRSVVTFTSGACSGEKRMVLHNTDTGTLRLDRPLPAVPSPGDSISVVRNCAKTPEECLAVFDNLPRFRGMPYVPTGTETEGM